MISITFCQYARYGKVIRFTIINAQNKIELMADTYKFVCQHRSVRYLETTPELVQSIFPKILGNLRSFLPVKYDPFSKLMSV